MNKMRAEGTEVESLENEFRCQGLALERVETETGVSSETS